MNKEGSDFYKKIVNAMINTCLIINCLLIGLSVILVDLDLFKIAGLSSALLLLSKVYRHYEQEI
tara:strand:+ start:420 stop:611 length:192 start_codon:yes stop_codon:yes gene_type:complete